MTSSRMTRRNFVTSAAVAGAAAAATFPRPAIAQLIKLRYTLSWLPTGQYAFIYSARQLGYFKKRGIDLEISRGYGSMAAIQAVASGQFEMGGAQTGANLLSIMKGLDLRLLGTQGYDATLGIVAPENASAVLTDQLNLVDTAELANVLAAYESFRDPLLAPALP